MWSISRGADDILEWFGWTDSCEAVGVFGWADGCASLAWEAGGAPATSPDMAGLEVSVATATEDVLTAEVVVPIVDVFVAQASNSGGVEVSSSRRAMAVSLRDQSCFRRLAACGALLRVETSMQREAAFVL